MWECHGSRQFPFSFPDLNACSGLLRHVTSGVTSHWSAVASADCGTYVRTYARRRRCPKVINQVAYVRADVFTCTYVPAHFRAASEEKMPARSRRRGVQLYSEVFMHVRTIAHGRRSITRTYRFTYVRSTVRTYRFTHVLYIPYRTRTCHVSSHPRTYVLT